MDWSTPSPRSGRRRRRNSKEKPGALPDTPPESTYPQPSRSAPPSNLATHQQGGPRGNRTRASLRPLADAWLAQYPFDKKITANDENTPYLELIPQAMNSPSLNLEGCFDSEQEAIRFFIAQDSLEFPDQELVLRVQKFCKGSHTALSLFTPPLLLSGEEGNIINASAPKVWIHDRDWSKNPQRNTRSYERVLTTKRQDQVLREKRLDNRTSFVPDVRRRLIFIGDGNGPSFYSLISTAPSSQVEALGKLIGQHLSQKPVTSIDIGPSAWWRGCFDFNFNLTYLAISPADQQDNRLLRSSHELSFLNVNSHESQGLESICPGSQEEVVLSEVVVSLCVMGLSESYWTAVCFKDEFHEGEPRLEEEDEVEEVDGTTTDPILFEEVSISPPSPRTYYFQALAKFLKMIIKHYKHFAERFGQAIPEPDSLSTQSLRTWMDAAPRTLEMVTGRVIELKDELQTLLKNAAIGSDGLPKAPLLQSLRDDSLAMKSLGTILKVYEDVGRVEKQLQRYGRSCAQLKESLRNEEIKERSLAQTISQSNERSVIRVAIFALAIAASALGVELYGVLPENLRSSRGFFIFLALFIALNTFALIWLLGGKWLRGGGKPRFTRS